MKNEVTSSITSFNPVVLSDWVLQVSRNNITKSICIVMFHRYEHTTRVGYASTKEDAATFISNIIENKGEE